MEIGVEFGTNSPDRTFSLELLVNLTAAEASRDYEPRWAGNPESVQRAVTTGAEGLKRYGDLVLSGDPQVFERLDTLASERITARVLRSKIRQIRPKAEAAFKRGDYAEAAGLYASIAEALSPVEIKKMELAKKRAADC